MSLQDKTDDEKKEAEAVGETLIKSSKIDEEEITKQLQQKLEDGNLQDANNDGVVNESDVEVAKADLQTFLAQPIGVAEHIDYVATAEKKVEALANAQDKLNSIKNL